jgi:hypothetical protein
MSDPQIRTLPTPISLDDFEVGVTLGTGSFGRVRFSTHKVMLNFIRLLSSLLILLFILIIEYWKLLGSQDVEKG